MASYWSVRQWFTAIYQCEYVPVRYRGFCRLITRCGACILCFCPLLVYVCYWRSCRLKRAFQPRECSYHHANCDAAQKVSVTSTQGTETESSDEDENDDVDYAQTRPNYMFFTNKLKSEPDGDYIDEIHRNWYDDYDRLETHHGFIQWLFPIRQPGVNAYAHRLQDHEIELIRQDRSAVERLLKSYEMMLNFYGIELVDKETGQVRRADNWQERFTNLNRHTHNNLRITRILTCLRLLNFPHLQPPLVKFFLNEIITEKTLYNCRLSCFRFWMTTLDRSVYDDVQAYKQQLEQETTAKSRGEVEPRPNGKMFGNRTNKAGVPLQPDVVADKTRTDDGHRDASSIATSEQQLKLMTSSTGFQDQQQQQQRECDDTELETVSEWKDDDDTVTSNESPAVTSSQQQLESTVTVGRLEVNNNKTRSETKDEYEEMEEEQLGHCQPRTETSVEKQPRESDLQHNAPVDVQNPDNKIDSQEQSEEMTQEHEEHVSNSQHSRTSTEEQSSKETGTGQERDELVREKVEEMMYSQEEEPSHYYPRSDETSLEEQQSQDSNSEYVHVQHHVLVDVRNPDTSQEEESGEVTQEDEEHSRRTSSEEQSSEETGAGQVRDEVVQQQQQADISDDNGISDDVSAVNDCTTEDSIQHTVH